MFAVLPDRYQLGSETAEGTQVLRRTGRARFNPMRVWVRPAERTVRGEYEVRGDPAAAKALLDARVSSRLAGLGLQPADDSVQDWGGSVLTRLYQGKVESADQAAAAIRFFCEESEQQVNLAAE
jgi:hypothetical protein